MGNNNKERNIAGLDVIEFSGDPDGATVILFHGFGANAMDLAPLRNVFLQKPRPTVLFPNGPLEIQIAPGFKGRAWFPVDIEALQNALHTNDYKSVAQAFPQELTQIREHVERLIGELYIPRSKLILGGFSQGAVLAIETALHSIDRLAALLIFSGTLIYESVWSRLSHQHHKTPFFQSHGTDDPLLPLENAKNLEALLLKGGFDGKLHIFKGSHEIPQTILIQLSTFLDNLLS